MEFLEIPLFDDDFFKMIFRFALNLIFLFYIIRYLYYPSTRRRDYMFTFYMISIIVFFLCFTLKKYELDLGMALGLFAIFGIIRYRTAPMNIREMTYLFVVIGVSVINALANKKMSYAEILGANLLVVTSMTIIERVVLFKHEIHKEILYENIENIKPENEAALIEDLQGRTGLEINRVDVGKVDFLRESVQITIFYFKNQGI
jgi:hypothetical protein